MKKIKNAEIFLIIIIFLLSILTFNLIFDSTSDGSFYQNIIAAFLGTLLTVAITSFLLKKQSKADELRETNVEVFRRKVDRYEQMTNLMINVFEDKNIDPNEAKQINTALHNMALFCSPDSLRITADFLRQNTLNDLNREINLLDLISQYRKDLKLDDFDEFLNYDLKPIGNLISENFNNLSVYKTIHFFMKSIEDALLEDDQFDIDIEYDPVEGSLDSISMGITMLKSNIYYEISIDYPESMDSLNANFEVELIIQGIWNEKIQEKIAPLNFTYTNQSELENEDTENQDGGLDIITKYYPLNASFSNNKFVIKTKPKSILKKVLNDIISIDSILKSNSERKKIKQST